MSTTSRRRLGSAPGAILALLLLTLCAHSALAYDAYLRFKVAGTDSDKYTVTTGGWRHDGDPSWYLPVETYEVAGGRWSDWIDVGRWKPHTRLDRAGGIAEWAAVKLSVTRTANHAPVNGCQLDIQLADRASDASVVATLHETSGSNAVGFLLPVPLRDHAKEIETGSQMAARHLAWATAASGGSGDSGGAGGSGGSGSSGSSGGAPQLKKFDVITSVWGHYDPKLELEEAEALQRLGFNIVGGVSAPVLKQLDLRTYTSTWHLLPDPEQSAATWAKSDGASLVRQRATPEGRWLQDRTAYCVVTDEIQTFDFRKTDPERLNTWFRAYLRDQGQTDASLGRPIDQVDYPAKAMFAKSLPRDADLTTRKIDYFAAKFGQWWTVKQLHQTTDLYKANVPGGKTETLPADHAFFDAWGPPHVGMAARNLDLFEIGHEQAVDIISTEDWLGLNHMYGPGYTWTGAQSHEYLAAIFRSGIGDRPVALRSLITVSDDKYLRLKAYSALAQGVKSFFFWTYGPTFIATENYWSDLRSEYDGIAHLTRALAKSEDVLFPARPVRDPVAILYSVSHDIWNTEDPAAFVETRLTWHALRHLSIQPDFLREEDAEAGRLQDYKVVYLADQCLTRAASAALDQWVKEGGVLYLAAGAATRDQFNEPYLPPFAAAVWPDNAANVAVHQSGHSYNERTDLPGIQPLTTAKVKAQHDPTFVIKVIGWELPVRAGLPPQKTLAATFEDGRPASAVVPYGKGKIVAVGFMPGLAYSPFQRNQQTLTEVWHEGPRGIFAVPLELAGVHPVAESSVPVVEASLLHGPEGDAVVLANYTYKPIPYLRVTLRGENFHGQAVSTEGSTVKVTPGAEPGTVVLHLPLEWTDIVLLP